MEGDNRVAWIQQRVLKGLDIDNGLFTEMMTEKDSDRAKKDRFLAEFDGAVWTLRDFLEGETPAPNGRALFFFLNMEPKDPSAADARSQPKVPCLQPRPSILTLD